MSQGVMSAADGPVRSREDAGANPATLTISDGWQSSNAPVPKTERAVWLRGCNPYTIRHRPVAQKQSIRLISGRPRSVTARDDHFSFSGLWGLASHFPRVAEAD
jgi:hypothetical protein